MKKILFFDIDGTLLLTGGCGKIAFERAFEEVFSVQNVWGETIPDGKTDPMIFQEIARRVLNRPLGKSEYEHLLGRYVASFREEIWRSPRFRLMPGIAQLIENLSGDDRFVLAIVTGNVEETAWLKLERAGMRDAFHFGGFGSDSDLRGEIVEIALKRAGDFLKTSVPPDQTYMIGDTLRDIEAAREHRFKTIAVSTGRYAREDFLALAPDHILSDLSDTEHFKQLLT